MSLELERDEKEILKRLSSLKEKPQKNANAQKIKQAERLLSEIRIKMKMKKNNNV